VHTDDETAGSVTVAIRPSLAEAELRLVAGLAGAGPGPRQVWPGQPGRRSPWRPCTDGCCVVLAPRPGPGVRTDPVEWLRFLLREVLAPQAREPVARARRLGLPGGHRVEGQVLLDGVARPRLLVAAGRRVRVLPLDEDPVSGLLSPTPPAPRRARGEVVDLVGHVVTAEDGSRARGSRDQSTER
jgi:hypothetical protein